MTLSDSAKYSMTRSVARSFCDSWTSCFLFRWNNVEWNSAQIVLRNIISLWKFYVIP